jgi:hypothetical protein
VPAHALGWAAGAGKERRRSAGGHLGGTPRPPAWGGGRTPDDQEQEPGHLLGDRGGHPWSKGRGWPAHHPNGLEPNGLEGISCLDVHGGPERAEPSGWKARNPWFEDLGLVDADEVGDE